MYKITDNSDGHLVAEMTRVMLNRFGASTAATTEALERRCMEAGDVKRAAVMREVRKRVAGRGQFVDMVV